MEEVHDRTAGFLEAFIPRVERQLQHENILLVSHAATVITLVRELLADRALRFRVGCCVVSTATRKPDTSDRVRGAWVAGRLGDGGFLTGGVQRDWGFEDVELIDGEVRAL